MKLEDFTTLLEIQSLENMIHKQLECIKQQNERISNLRQKRKLSDEKLQEKKLALNLQKKEMSQHENKLYEIESRLEKSKTSLTFIKNNQQLNALKSEMDHLAPQKDQLESASIILMDKIDQLQDDISELENFLKGSEKSLEIIAEEVKTEISLHQKEIDFCNERITNLLNTLEPNTQNLFGQTNKKHQFNNPLCFIEQFKCSYCHWPIERNLASSVEKGTIIELCPQCERILTPQAAKV